ncbi:unnamed protein product [Cuscuta campestris]|uniref:Uncharacterized protein n=1 Tax=Cuscuta campestris TaxID=132261 RepID=A0A484MYH8_9ASTE|nr:unnamed protein product [Cuscuta campestris]
MICLLLVCGRDERVAARWPAAGVCPICGGAVQAVVVESQWNFCFFPLYAKTKQKFYCTSCLSRLILIQGTNQFRIIIRCI